MTVRPTLRLGVFSPSVLLAVAVELGHLPDVDVVPVPVPASPVQFSMLRDGDIDAGLTSPDNVMRFRYSDANPLGARLDVRILAALDRGLGLSLFGRSGVDSLDVLRGGRLGVDVAASGFAFAAYEMLRLRGWSRGTDYQVVELGSTPRRLEALAAQRCDLTMLNAGVDLAAEQAGLCRLARLSEAVHPYLGTVLVATGEICSSQPAPLRKVALGLRAAAEDLCAGRGHPAACTAAQRLLGLGEAAAQRYLDTLLSPGEGLIRSARLQGTADPGLLAVATLRARHEPPANARSGSEVTEEAAQGDLVALVSADPDLVSAWPLDQEGLGG